MNTTIIARNSVWLGAEFVIDSIGGIVTSVAIARVLGPAELGYYVYIAWLTRISIVLGNVGIPASAVKYMAQYWASGQRAIARSVFDAAVRIQVCLACVIAAGGCIAVLVLGDPKYRIAAICLVLSVLPAMINTMPTIANVAIEKPGANVPGSICSAGLYALGVGLSLVLGWNLSGVAASVLVSRSVELGVRAVPVRRWIGQTPRIALPNDVRKKLRTFSAQSLVLMVLGVVVWDRSEILFLKSFCADIRQVAFYSVAFGLTDSILGVVRIFGNSIGTTMRAQYGRDEGNLRLMLPISVCCLALLAFPLYLGLAAVSGPAILIGYGKAYAPAIPVLMISALLMIPKAFQVPVQAFLQSTERQGFMVWWGLCCAGLNLGLDRLLIPRYAAIGAAYGNGLSQSIAIIGLWIGALKMAHVKVPCLRLVRLLACSMMMAAAVWLVRQPLGPALGAIIGIPTGIVLFLWLLRLSGALDTDDLSRFRQIRSGFPRPLRVWLDRGMTLMIVEPPVSRVASR